MVVRWSDEKDLLVSGMLAGGSELARTPAIIDVPLGKGHVVLFGNNPMWRHETHGSFMLLLNTAPPFRPPALRTNEPASDKRVVRQYTIQQFLATTAISGPSFSPDGSRCSSRPTTQASPTPTPFPSRGVRRLHSLGRPAIRRMRSRSSPRMTESSTHATVAATRTIIFMSGSER